MDETCVTDIDDSTGIGFRLWKLKSGQQHTLNSPHETAVLHMTGELRVGIGEADYVTRRDSLFDEAPFAVHLPPRATLRIQALSDVEIACFETENSESFEPKVYFPEATGNERRGLGQVGNCALRYVRTIFDNSTSDPRSQLVLGEVVNFPGRWSSYPPHHHPQPEIYHYRFSDTRGYGHAELGETVRKVRHGDTVKILDGVDHAQCAAPGYGMYYIWVIRHLADLRYTVPEFTEDHAWTMDQGAQFWNPAAEEVLQ